MEITTINLGACPLKYLSIGYRDEYGARPVSFDFSAWATEYGAGVLQLLLQRPGDADPYPVVLDIDGTTATWTPDEVATKIEGQGRAQLLYTRDGLQVRDAVFTVLIAPSLGAAGDPPEPYEDWLERLLTIAAEAQQSAIDAAGSAEAAGTSADLAAAAKTAAETAQAGAEAAKTGAEAAEITAGQSAALAGEKATQAAQSAQTAEQKASAAEQSAEDAQAALEAVRLAADAAETFKDDAQAAADGANQAKTDAQSAASAAAASAAVAQELIDQIPDIEAEIDGKAPAIYESIGPSAIASFADGADDMPLRTLTVDILATQSGTGDPSPENVRPFVGRESVTLHSSGENLVNVQLSQLLPGRFDSSGGITGVSSNVSKHTPKIPIKGGATITAFFGGVYTQGSACLIYYDSDGNFLSSVNQRNARQIVLEVPEDAASVAFSYFTNVYTGITVVPGAVPPEQQIPYVGGAENIPFPAEAGTVYGGTLTINADGSGTLSVPPHYASYNGETLVGPWVSSMDVYAEGTTPTIGAEVIDLGGEATVYQLTAEQLRTLAGVNNIWSNAGDVTVEYPADTKSYIDEQTAELSGQIDALQAAQPKTVTVTGTVVSITAEDNVRYVCGEVSTLTLTPPASGICDVVFTSGTTATVLTVPSTVRWPAWFDPTALEANTTYEINVQDGLAVVATWAA